MGRKNRPLTKSELKLMRKLGLNPSLTQADVAKEFRISRCAVNQTWRALEMTHKLRIRSHIDYGLYGVKHIFGWAKSKLGTKTLQRFKNWLHSSDFTSVVKASRISSDMDSIVYFEALFLDSSNYSWFMSQIERFRKMPYKLNVEASDVISLATHMNLGLFDGETWNFESGFQIRASIGAAGKYVDILPESRMIQYSEDNGDTSLEELIIATTLEQNYHSSAPDAAKQLKKVRLPPPSHRTLRRRLIKVRLEGVIPYLDLQKIELTQEMLVCVKGLGDVSKLLKAQLISFPSCGIVSGRDMIAFQIKLPNDVDWFKISQIILGQAVDGIFTFIAAEEPVLKRPDSIITHLRKRTKQ